MIAAILAASFTFTATATGVGKGTPLEFVFAGKNSDRDYESMFLLDEPLDVLCRRLEAAGLPRGKPTDTPGCRLWPVGCRLEFTPSLDEFVKTTLPDGVNPAPPIYTGGSRTEKGSLVAADEMPSALFSLYTLSQSPIVFDGIYEQGIVYGAHLAAKEMKKGTKVQFAISWDPQTMPRHLDLNITETNATTVLAALREHSSDRAVDATISFDPSLTLAAATAAASALSLVDSPRVKINGCVDGNLFYRAFMPDLSWTNRTVRLTQPFELTILDDVDRLIFIDEDWSVEGDDPKLTPREIPFAEAASHAKTDTCFIFAPGNCRLSRVYAAMAKLKGANVRTWYVFTSPNP